MIIFGLTGCGLISFGDKEPSEESTRLNGEELKTDVTVSNAKNLAEPPSMRESMNDSDVIELKDTTTPHKPEIPELEQAKGLSAKRLFENKLRSDDDRFERLENAVQAMRDEFDTIKPTVERLSTVEADLQSLVSQLNTMVNNGVVSQEDVQIGQLNNDPAAIDRALGVNDVATSLPPATPSAPQNSSVTANGRPIQLAPPSLPNKAKTNVTEAPIQPSAPAAVNTSSAQLVNIRMADSPGKTRIVMESTASLSFTSDLDNNEKILTLIFPTGTTSDMGNLPLRSSLIKTVSETAQPNGGFILAFTLNKASSIVDKGTIPPGGTSPVYRLWVDLSR